MFLLAIAGFGISFVHGIPVTSDEANAHAIEVVRDPGDRYVWACPHEDGTYSTEILEMHVEPSVRTDVLRLPTVFVRAPVLLIDPKDPYVLQVADHILSLTEGCSDLTKVRAALCFVQTGIRYVTDSELYGCTEYWAVPSETLRYHAGDCEDTSVLFVSVVEAMGYGAVLLDYAGHEAAGVFLDDYAQDYLYCETASDIVTAPGIGKPAEEPVVYVPGEFSPWKECANALIADYRDIIERVLGT